MAGKNSLTQPMAQLADDVLFGGRVLYRELDDIFGHVSGRLPREANREGLLFARMRRGPRQHLRGWQQKCPLRTNARFRQHLDRLGMRAGSESAWPSGF